MTLPVMQIGADNDVSAATAAPPPILGTYKRPPVEMVRGNGVYLYDETGKAYLDFASGIAVNALGYNDAGIAGAIKDALQTGLLHTSNLYRTRPGEELAQFLVTTPASPARSKTRCRPGCCTHPICTARGPARSSRSF